ncbi:hypothetical protein [Streptomyces resistomycificus]|uniref:ABC transporter permease n=1 Tax=Streptomyces resistomycificus TaxID=67356 RepID=A0A0L8L4P5_9ACTN|nr:hypothetical protein [Streptomyces resistomycificus]KOG33163.1 hypothetical protein ADK37_24170 [Streptomyces resistomycificus]KUN96362.1 hypothetical protein AQJ84_18370 [Streptomyces resistomycificus]
MTADRGLIRTVLRLHRTALVVWTVFVLAAVAGLVWLNTVTVDSVRAALDRCPDNAPGFCGALWASLDYSEPTGWISTLMLYSFWAVAAWAGGSLIGRELESGTAQLAWTQAVTPLRWLAVKLALPALLIVLGGAVFVPVYRWAWSANRDLMGDDWTFNDVFAAHGPAVVAYGLCALAVGTLAGLLLRRSLPALGVAVAVMVVLNQYLEIHRADFWPTKTAPGRKEMPNDWWQQGDGHYHPPSHFWPLHLVETGILLTVTAVATAAAFWLLHRRTTGLPAPHAQQARPRATV